MNLKLGMQHRVLEYYQVCSNDAPGLTLTCFMARSELVLYAFVFSGPHFRLPRFDSPLTTPSEVKINGRRILTVINYYIKNALFVKCLYSSLYPVV